MFSKKNVFQFGVGILNRIALRMFYLSNFVERETKKGERLGWPWKQGGQPKRRKVGLPSPG